MASFYHSKLSKGLVLTLDSFHHSFNTYLLSSCLSFKYWARLCGERSEEERVQPCPQGTFSLLNKELCNELLSNQKCNWAQVQGSGQVCNWDIWSGLLGMTLNLISEDWIGVSYTELGKSKPGRKNSHTERIATPRLPSRSWEMINRQGLDHWVH